MSVQYHCPHLSNPSAPLPSSYASSSTSFFPFDQLYFCEECDAVRCDLCCVTEIASYFCPNCTFDVPSANVRGDKNRCARNCFSCPDCATPLQVQATGLAEDAPDPAFPTGPPFLLVCPCCRWSSRQVGLKFDKSTGLATQLQKMQTGKDPSLPEFEAVKDHLEAYISTPAPTATPARPGTRQPTRHVSHLTQMAARALHRDVPGMAAVSAASRSALRREVKPGTERASWDEIGEYKAKESWGGRGLITGNDDVEEMRRMIVPASRDGESRALTSWMKDSPNTIFPERIPLQTKLTKRCPHQGCRHLLIQPDTKSTRFKIKMIAGNYLPVVEVGRRRRIVGPGAGLATSWEDADVRRKERRMARKRAEEVDESMEEPLRAGQVYTFQMALINPLYDTIQVRLTQPSHADSDIPAERKPNHFIHIPTPHFLVNPLKDAWAYDEDDDLLEIEGTEGGASEDGASTIAASSKGTIGGGKRSRLSVFTTGSSAGLKEKERRRKEGDVERKGNISKAGIEVEILPGAKGLVCVSDHDHDHRYRCKQGGGGCS